MAKRTGNTAQHLSGDLTFLQGGIERDAIIGGNVEDASIEDNTLVIKYRMLDDSIETLRFIGTQQVSSVTRKAGVSANNVFVEADFTVDTETERFTIPVHRNPMYYALWQPAKETAITTIRRSGSNLNLFLRYGPPVALTIGTVAGFYWRANAQAPASASALDYVLGSMTDLPVFRRYFGQKAYADGLAPGGTTPEPPDFVAADFTGPVGASSLTAEVPQPGYVTPVGSTCLTDANLSCRHWVAWAVPETTPDILTVGTGIAAQDIDRFTRQAGMLQIGGVNYKVWKGKTLLRDLTGNFPPVELVQE